MKTAMAIRLLPNEKLELLRRLDRSHAWESLHDSLFCNCCGETITGQKIEVRGGTRPLGPLRLQCPTHKCFSAPEDWINADTILPAVRPADASPPNGASEGSAAAVTHHGLAWKIRRRKSLPRREPGIGVEEHAPRIPIGHLLAGILKDVQHSVVGFSERGRFFIEKPSLVSKIASADRWRARRSLNHSGIGRRPLCAWSIGSEQRPTHR